MINYSPNRFLHDKTKQIQWDVTRFAVPFEPKVQITQNKDLVKDIDHIYHKQIKSYIPFMQVSQKKIIIVALLLTHDVQLCW